MIEKFSTAETKIIITRNCLINNLIRCPLERIIIPTRIQSQKNNNNPISPKGILAYSCKNTKMGDHSARYNEKKKSHHKAIKETQSLYLLRIIFLLFLLFPKTFSIKNKKEQVVCIYFFKIFNRKFYSALSTSFNFWQTCLKVHQMHFFSLLVLVNAV